MDEYKQDKYFYLMRVKIGGVVQGFQAICPYENQGEQILKYFGIMEQREGCMKNLSLKINPVIQLVIVGDFWKLEIMSLCVISKRKMGLKIYKIKILISGEGLSESL